MRTPQVFCFPECAENMKQLRAKTKVVLGLENSLAVNDIRRPLELPY